MSNVEGSYPDNDPPKRNHFHLSLCRDAKEGTIVRKG